MQLCADNTNKPNTFAFKQRGIGFYDRCPAVWVGMGKSLFYPPIVSSYGGSSILSMSVERLSIRQGKIVKRGHIVDVPGKNP